VKIQHWMSSSVSTALASGTVLVGVGATSASAQGDPVGGSGATYYLNDSFTGSANIVFSYGDASDTIYFGDWDGNSSDTPMIQRGNSFHVRNSNSSGPADYTFNYGNPGDVVLTGDWDGDGIDTLTVRRGGTFL